MLSKCDSCDHSRKNNDHDAVPDWRTRLYEHNRWVALQRKKYLKKQDPEM